MCIKSFLTGSLFVLYSFLLGASNKHENVENFLKENMQYIENPNVGSFKNIPLTLTAAPLFDVYFKLNTIFFNLKEGKIQSNPHILIGIQNLLEENDNFSENIKIQLAKVGIMIDLPSDICYVSNEDKNLENVYYSTIKTKKEGKIIEKEDILFKDLDNEDSVYKKEFILNVACHAVLENIFSKLLDYTLINIKKSLQVYTLLQINNQKTEETVILETREKELNNLLIGSHYGSLTSLRKEDLNYCLNSTKMMVEKYKKELFYKNLLNLGMLHQDLLKYILEVEVANEEQGYLCVSRTKQEDSIEFLRKELEYHSILGRLYYVLGHVPLTTDLKNKEQLEKLEKKNKEFLGRDDIHTKTVKSFSEKLKTERQEFSKINQENGSLKFTLEKINEENKKLKKELEELKRKTPKKNNNRPNVNENNELIKEFEILRKDFSKLNTEKLLLEKEKRSSQNDVVLMKENIEFLKKQSREEKQKIKEETFLEKEKNKNLENEIHSLKEKLKKMELNKTKTKKITVVPLHQKELQFEKNKVLEFGEKVENLEKELSKQKNKNFLSEEEIENLKILQKEHEEKSIQENNSQKIQLSELNEQIEFLKKELEEYSYLKNKFLKLEKENKEFQKENDQLRKLNDESRHENEKFQKVNNELEKENNWWRNWNPYENTDPYLYPQQPPYYPQPPFPHMYNQQPYYEQPYYEQPYYEQNQHPQIQQNNWQQKGNNQNNKKKKQFYKKKKNHDQN